MKSVKLIGNVFVYDDSPRILETFWTKNVKTIDLEGSSRKCLEENIGSLSLTIKNVSPDDAGEYRLTAINAVGLSTSEVIVLGISVIILYIIHIIFTTCLFPMAFELYVKVLKIHSKDKKNLLKYNMFSFKYIIMIVKCHLNNIVPNESFSVRY